VVGVVEEILLCGADGMIADARWAESVYVVNVDIYLGDQRPSILLESVHKLNCRESREQQDEVKVKNSAW
jgi:hypothetical protein